MTITVACRARSASRNIEGSDGGADADAGVGDCGGEDEDDAVPNGVENAEDGERIVVEDLAGGRRRVSALGVPVDDDEEPEGGARDGDEEELGDDDEFGSGARDGDEEELGDDDELGSGARDGDEEELGDDDDDAVAGVENAEDGKDGGD